jgi:O-antigen/teichoic acid export membrane protein
MLTTVGLASLFGILIGQERHGQFAWLQAASGIAGPCAGLLVLALGGSVIAYSMAHLVAGGVLLLLVWQVSGLRLSRADFQVRRWIDLARRGLPFLGFSVTLRIRAEFDRIILVLLASAATTGWYASAYRIISIPQFIPTLIVMPLLPALSRHTADDEAFRVTLRRTLIAMLLLTVPISAGMLAMAPVIPGLLRWPEEFGNSVPLMMILAVQQPLVGLGSILGTGLVALNQEHRWLRVMALGTVANLTMNVALIPIFEQTTGNGAIGASMATVLTELLLLGGALMLMPTGVIDRRTTLMSAKVLAAGVCVAVSALVLIPVSLPLGVTAGVATFVVSLLALGVAGPRDLLALHRMTRELSRARAHGQGD